MNYIMILYWPYVREEINVRDVRDSVRDRNILTYSRQLHEKYQCIT